MTEKKASLTVLVGPLTGMHCVLPHSGTITIGSAPGSTFRLDTPAVSPYHARVVVEEGRITVHETGSERHLHVNDDPLDVDGTVLNNGDILWLGPPGGDDVVMLQCSVPSAAEARRVPKPAESGPIAPTPDIETQALWATEPESPPASPRVGAGRGRPTGFEETLALDLELGVPGGFEPPAASAEDGAAADETSKTDEPLGVLPEGGEGEAEEPLSALTTGGETDEALGASPESVGSDDEPLGGLAESPDDEETLVIAPEAAGPEEPLVVAPGLEGAPATEWRPFGTEESAPAAEEDAPAPTAIYFTAPDDEIVEAAIASPEPTEPPAEPPAPVEQEPPLPLLDSSPPVAPGPAALPQFEGPPRPPVVPSPPPAPPQASPTLKAPDFNTQVPRPPSASHGPTPRSPSLSHPSASQPPRRREPTLRPDAAHAVRPPPRPTAAAPGGVGDEPEGRGAPRSAILAVAGFVGVLVVAGLGWAVWRSMSSRPTFPSPSATPKVAEARRPVSVTPAPPPAMSEPTPLPEPRATPVPFATPPLAAPTPQAAAPATPVPTPTPTPTAAPRATPIPTPAGPSAEAQRAQQAAAQAQALVGEAETAIGAHQYDAAISRLDDALRLQPGNAQATSLRADAVRRRDFARRKFVAGRTVVLTEKAQKEDALAGFDTGDADLRKAPDFQGHIEFEMSPASGLEPGVPWTLRVFVVNEGKKAIRIQGLNVGTAVNGTTTGGSAAPKARDIQPQQRALVGEVTGSWQDGTTSWSTEVAITANKGDSLKSTITWR
jgi:FHA domain